ncbi:uncharacterized protein LOC123448116 isoform X2 [Hordeum vulgare subsp. vulgare]|uniref:uncharacterized protein LOC123448116 isoform X2 n=1 Tax=Hordeum vulgare subsp. vulgare TaxID=112509 RepID=UPI001D1A3FD4|nr:uncharacterized protein LOC123448116 isoform X2 [Hordeum vulgare subsp. vulgare]
MSLVKFYENPLPFPPTNTATHRLVACHARAASPSPRHAHRRGHRPLAPSLCLAAVSIALPTAGLLLPLVSPLLFFHTRSSRWKESPFLQARNLPAPAAALPCASSGSGEAPIHYAALRLARASGRRCYGGRRSTPDTVCAPEAIEDAPPPLLEPEVQKVGFYLKLWEHSKVQFPPLLAKARISSGEGWGGKRQRRRGTVLDQAPGRLAAGPAWPCLRKLPTEAARERIGGTGLAQIPHRRPGREKVSWDASSSTHSWSRRSSPKSAQSSRRTTSTRSRREAPTTSGWDLCRRGMRRGGDSWGTSGGGHGGRGRRWRGSSTAAEQFLDGARPERHRCIIPHVHVLGNRGDARNRRCRWVAATELEAQVTSSGGIRGAGALMLVGGGEICCLASVRRRAYQRGRR